MVVYHRVLCAAHNRYVLTFTRLATQGSADTSVPTNAWGVRCDVMPATMSLGHRNLQLHCNLQDHCRTCHTWPVTN